MSSLTQPAAWLLLSLTAAASASASEAFSIAQLRAGVFRGHTLSAPRSMADGKHYTALTPDGRAIVKYRYADGEAVDTLLSLDNVQPEKGLDVSQLHLAGYDLSDDGERLVVWSDVEPIYRRSYKAQYYYYVIEAGGVRRRAFKRLATEKVQAVTMAPDGRQLAYVKDGNIFYVRVMSAGIDLAVRQVTDDGAAGKIRNGLPDWVYEEEFAFDRALSWSSDSQTLCYLRWDESAVKQYNLPMYRASHPEYTQYSYYPGTYEYKYPVAGEQNASVSAWAYDVMSRKVTALKVPLPHDGYMPRLQAMSEADKVAVVTLNRDQNTLSLYAVSTKTGLAKLLVQDTNEAYISEENLDAIRFYDDGFTFMSERTGFRHLYFYNNMGHLQRPLTTGNYDVSECYGYNPKTQEAFVQTAWQGEHADLPSALLRGIYRIDAKGKMHALFHKGHDGTGCRGTHSAAFSADFTYMLHTYSDALTPPVVTLETVRDLKVLHTLEDNASLQEIASQQPERTFFQFTTERGDVLNGYMITPANDGSRHPAVLYQYGGPGSQQVLDRWEFDFPQYLASQGFVAITVDGRGTGGRGAAWERQTYLCLGVKEAEDQLSAGRFAASLPIVDADRIGIWGWSFGGYNTLMTLTAGNNVFKAGVAVAPVTDFRFYDTVYTERYMRTPQQNASGYEKSSVFSRLDQLKGQLLLVTGTADDNVHPQNTFELADRLVQDDYDFDMMTYTNRNHSIRGGNANTHIYKKIFSFFKSHL